MSYVVFVAPALLVSAAVMVGVEESTYQVLGGTQWDAKTYYTIYQAAVSPGQLTLGVLLAIQVRVAAVAGLYWIAMLVFGVLPQPGTGLAIPLVAMLGALAFGAPVAGYFAGLDREGGRSTMVRRFVLMPLVLFSGVYYPLSVLPWASSGSDGSPPCGTPPSSPADWPSAMPSRRGWWPRTCWCSSDCRSWGSCGCAGP
ncbi:hypothetical protein A5N15_05325 [Rothia kristinae]|uniref:ABC-2 type transporter domain-containing protein n=1 Tax=Rothia kristinae TaxID=37923 RepID=A0A657IW55_9MICC|nr:hypothetical protein A5N15_05325 [Rothia kristinae]